MSSQSQHRRLSRSVVNININFIKKLNITLTTGAISSMPNLLLNPPITTTWRRTSLWFRLGGHLYGFARNSPARSPWLRMHQSQLPPTSAQILDCTNSLFNWGEKILASSNAFAFISPSPHLPLHSNRERGGMLAKVERTTEHATIYMATNNSMGKWFSL